LEGKEFAEIYFRLILAEIPPILRVTKSYGNSWSLLLAEIPPKLKKFQTVATISDRCKILTKIYHKIGGISANPTIYKRRKIISVSSSQQPSLLHTDFFSTPTVSSYFRPSSPTVPSSPVLSCSFFVWFFLFFSAFFFTDNVLYLHLLFFLFFCSFCYFISP